MLTTHPEEAQGAESRSLTGWETSSAGLGATLPSAGLLQTPQRALGLAGARPPFARRGAGSSRHGREGFCPKVSSAAHARDRGLPWRLLLSLAQERDLGWFSSSRTSTELGILAPARQEIASAPGS